LPTGSALVELCPMWTMREGEFGRQLKQRGSESRLSDSLFTFLTKPDVSRKFALNCGVSLRLLASRILTVSGGARTR